MLTSFRKVGTLLAEEISALDGIESKLVPLANADAAAPAIAPLLRKFLRLNP
jgi:hypothetical protein